MEPPPLIEVSHDGLVDELVRMLSDRDREIASLRAALTVALRKLQDSQTPPG